MKVLNLVTSPRPFFDNQVRTLEARGVDVTTICVPGRESQSETRSLTDYLAYYPHVLGQSLSGYDLVHANYGLTAPFALTQPTRPVVLTLWGSDLMGRYARVSERCSAFCDAIVVPTSAMAAQLSSPADLIPFGVDSDLFRPIPQEVARERVGWPTDERIALFPYDPSRSVKNYDLAETVVAEAAGQLTLESLGDVSYDRMPLYMNASDLVLVTSRRESGPLTVKEAALCNVPIVSTDVGFVRDVLSPVQSAHVCESKAELVAGVDAVLQSDVAPSGRDELKANVSMDRMGDQLVDVYERVLE
ncbi:glycosyltransferase [Halovivax ruber XH-70]|uniref:Glycosyltransferase n=1 Tax=Halovivax ruber (strain DSM 18193 / JCM 13892 / XH-70) TaxID=797302 RepID=L0I865_HALRX|nr:glycosyltransferase [Halovivax ruber XH-70]